MPILIGALTAVLLATAQAQGTDTLPKELVSVLMRGMNPTETFDLKLGPAPADFPLDVRASLVRDPRRQCLAGPTGMNPFFADITVPELFPPSGMRTGGGGSSGSTDSWSSSTVSSSPLAGVATKACSTVTESM